MTAGNGSDASKSIVGKAARRLDERPLAERIELPRKTVRRLVALAGVCAVVS